MLIRMSLAAAMIGPALGVQLAMTARLIEPTVWLSLLAYGVLMAGMMVALSVALGRRSSPQRRK